MVNLSKRLSLLQPKLLDLRHGKGAHILPPAPAPQLVHVFLRYPRRHGLKPDARTDGAHQFGSRYLPRLKYHNPKLKVDIKTDGNTHAPMKLMLQFEGTDPDALRAIAKKQQSPNWRDAPAPKEAPAQGSKGKSKKPTADDDEVVIKEKPESELGLQSNTPVYSRSVTLSINSKSLIAGAQLQQEKAALEKAKKASERLFAE
ncbi:hypothetical protein DV738_g3029, partial [Chaetothyriales sp. CBS 135597]